MAPGAGLVFLARPQKPEEILEEEVPEPPMLRWITQGRSELPLLRCFLVRLYIALLGGSF